MRRQQQQQGGSGATTPGAEVGGARGGVGNRPGVVTGTAPQLGSHAAAYMCCWHLALLPTAADLVALGAAALQLSRRSVVLRCS